MVTRQDHPQPDVALSRKRTAITVVSGLALGTVLALSDQYFGQATLAVAPPVPVLSTVTGLEAAAPSTIATPVSVEAEATASTAPRDRALAGASAASAAYPLPVRAQDRTQPSTPELAPINSAAAQAKMSRPLAAIAQAGGGDRVEVIVRHEDDAGIDLAQLEALGGSVKRRFDSLRMTALSLPASALEALAVQSTVRTLSLDGQIKGLVAGAGRATARFPQSGSSNAGFSGTGVGIAVIDSGVGAHADLNNVERIHLIEPATVPTQSLRHDDAVQALYVFDEASGERLFDRADAVNPGAEVLHLDLENSANAEWDEDGLALTSTRLSAESTSQGHFGACKASNAISLEAWVQPGNTSQGGPARIISYSNGSSSRNFTLAQDGSRYVLRLRTTTNGSNGMNERLRSPAGSLQSTLQHVVAVRDASGDARLYIDGVLVDQETISGTFSNWDSSHAFGLGNEFQTSPTSTNRNWEGTYRLAAVHCRALNAAEVADHFAAGSTPYATDQDPYGHGTHVAGILAGSGAASGSSHRGGADGARLYSLRVLDDEGMGTVSDAIAAMDWLVTHGAEHGIKVANLSFGMGVEQSIENDPLVLATESVWDAGITVVVAAGNNGRDGNMTINSPGNSRKIITVGSLTDSGSGSDYSDDYVSTYSSMGPTLMDHVLKP
ncbi:MAG: S8 family serine peptidase, partial [Pseudomonadota bacterium]